MRLGPLVKVICSAELFGVEVVADIEVGWQLLPCQESNNLFPVKPRLISSVPVKFMGNSNSIPFSF